ncbi:MAG: carbohydrate kinase family protein [Verrucomicrobia bacterium]|nr:carbohydrate kinase family protein [Verrucomicrobiota bacterium]
MFDIIIAGNVNLCTTVQVGAFPVEYAKTRYVRHGISDHVSGVGLNVSASIASLGHRPCLSGVIGNDVIGDVIITELDRRGIGAEGVVRDYDATPRSLVLEGEGGMGAIFTDLKDDQVYQYPEDSFRALLEFAERVHVTNINWAYPLALLAKEAGKPVSTDVQSIFTLDDPYNKRFIEIADLVFFSDEQLDVSIEDVMKRLWHEFDVQVAVCGRGPSGATMGVRDQETLYTVKPLMTRPPVSTTGAGDAMVGSFLSSLLTHYNEVDALIRSQIFAGHKIGEVGSTSGLMSRHDLDAAFAAVKPGRVAARSLAAEV